MTVETAKEFAKKAHGDQKYGALPYDFHLQMVATNVRRYKNSIGSGWEDVEVAAWLHDIIEDTAYTVNDLGTRFSPEVVALVQAVSNCEGSNRKERNLKTYEQIKKAGRLAIALKLADRISNVYHSKTNNNQLYAMYKKEHTDFQNILRNGEELKEMWEYLNNLL